MRKQLNKKPIFLAAAALALTASGFIAWIIYFVGYVLTMMGSVLAGLYVQHMVLEGGAAKAAAEKLSSMKSGVTGWFGAKFSGA